MQITSAENLKDPTRIHPSVTLTIVKVMDSYGLDSAALLQSLGINVKQDLTLDKRVVGSLHDDVWRIAQDKIGCDAIGIEFTKHFQISSLSGLGFCWAASNTLLDGFMRFSRYFTAVSTAGKIVITEESSTVTVTLKLPVPYGIAADVGVDSMLALLLHLSRMVSGSNLNPDSVNLQRPKPKSYKIFDSFFKCPIFYGSQYNQIIFAKADTLARLPMADPELARANDQIVRDYIRKQDLNNFVSRVASIIAEELPLGTPSTYLVAKKLNISGKTLQRKLQEEQSCFSTLLERIRSDLAEKYLRNNWRSIAEISYLLGFTEPSNFTRWFKKNAGLSPGQYRDKLESLKLL